jgi:hypothetical protein
MENKLAAKAVERLTKGPKIIHLEDLTDYTELRVYFPGGNMQLIPTTDGNLWAHINVEQPTDYEGGGRIKTIRLDCINKPVHQTNASDLNNPNLYHIGFLIEEGEKRINSSKL